LLIIFDLDDTLIDTTNSLTPFFLKKALKSMIRNGLEVKDELLAYKKIIQIDKTSISANETIKKFLNSINADLSFYPIALKAMRTNSIGRGKIYPLKNTKKVLKFLFKKHVIALVTIGNKKFQFDKIKKAGIDKSIFSKIVVVQDKNKGYHYKKIINELNFTYQDTYVCGDKVNIDLKPAKKLGCRTIHMKAGRGKNFKKDKDVDFSISNIEEIKKIFN